MLPDQIRITDRPAHDLLDFLNERNYSSMMVLTDEHTHRLCHPLLAEALPPHTVIQVPSGEENKNLDTCTRIWDGMTAHQLDRNGVLLIIGGGVLGDMGGFCAATYKRGVDFVLIPTTLLAMVDASIGGKLGIDYNFYKNHIGVFKEPACTLLYSRFLKTLPERELRSGFAEVIKHTLISDAAMFDRIRRRELASQEWDVLIRHSVEFKYAVTREDPHERGRRKILNAGHTIGHALETHQLRKGQKIMHGEAVAAGLAAEALLAERKGMLSGEERALITGYIQSTFGSFRVPEEDARIIAQLCLQDKKNLKGRILSVLLDGIGNAKWNCEVTPAEIIEALVHQA